MGKTNDFILQLQQQAASDQQQAATCELSTLIHTYFEALLAQGFEAEQAMQLTIAFQDGIVKKIGSG